MFVVEVKDLTYDCTTLINFECLLGLAPYAQLCKGYKNKNMTIWEDILFYQVIQGSVRTVYKKETLESFAEDMQNNEQLSGE